MSDASQRLNSILDASSVALIGASERTHYHRAVVKNLHRVGMPVERVHFVNPNRETAFGRPCYPTISALPEVPDVVLIATPAATIPDLIAECVQAKVPAAIVVSSGFAETGGQGRQRQREITRLATEGGLVLLGPSSLGFVSLPGKVGFFATPLPETLKVGVVSAAFQSGGMLNLFLMQLAARGVGLSSAVVTGNEAMFDLVDYIERAVDDSSTRVIVVYAESIARGPAFGAALRRAEAAGKPLIVLKAGSSARGQRNVMTHSGNLASSSSSWRAFLKQGNAITVGNLDELIEAVVVASADQRGDVHPQGRAACLMSVSGGDCTLLADLAERTGWDLPDLSEEGHAQLIEVVGKQTLADNPLDVGGLWRKGLVPEVASIVAGHSPAGVVAFRLNLPDEPEPELLDAYRVLARSARAAGQFPVALTRASERISDFWYTFFSDLDVPLLHEYEQALRALGRIADYHESRARRLEAALRQAQASARTPPADVVAWFKALPPGPLSFSRCMELLEVYDIPLVQSVIVATEAEATAAADGLGYPVVVKADSQAVSHRSEIGAVRINLENREAVAAAYRDVLRNVNAVADGAVTSRVIVQAQLPRGVELLVGSTLDPELGQVLSMGLGGVFVEIFRDIAQRVTPLSSLDFSEMLAELRGRPLLEGARGTAVSDVAALERLVASVSLLAWDLGEDLSELDLNPVIVLPDGRGAWAVDVLIVRSGSGAIAASRPDPKLTKAVAQ